MPLKNLNSVQKEAIAEANAYLSNVALPTYSDLQVEIKRFEWMLKTRASVFTPRDRDGFACQFNTYYFSFGSTEREAIDKAMEEHSEQLTKAGYHENIRGAEYYK